MSFGGGGFSGFGSADKPAGSTLFGSATPAANGANGSGATSSAATNGDANNKPNLFGGLGTSKPATSGTSLFGGASNTAPSSPAVAGGNLFGSSTTPASGGTLFGSSTTPSFGGSKPGGGIFGSNTAAPATTSAAPTSTTPATTSTTAGATTTAPGSSTPLFGAANGFGAMANSSKPNEASGTPAKPTFGSSILGSSTTPAGNPSGGGSLFPSKTSGNDSPATTTTASSSLFPNVKPLDSNAKPAGSSLFDTPVPPGYKAKDSSLFATPPPPGTATAGASAPVNNLIPKKATDVLTNAGWKAKDSALFAPIPSNAATSAPATTSATTTASAAPATSAATTTASATTSLFPNAPPIRSSLFPSADAPKTSAPSTSGTSSLFPTLGSSTSAGATPATTATAGPSTTTAPATENKLGATDLFGKGTSKPADNTLGSALPMFGGKKEEKKDEKAEEKKDEKKTETKKEGEEPKEKLGASLLGAAPPAKSRLKNKTMDEIITRWATDLSKYQKEFQSQAEQVSAWDRLVVENASKIQKLYGSTVDAERATAEVERQLAAVENQQDELGLWLDRYEQEVEELLEKQVGPADALQGPDQEREKTYKLAERVSDRLNSMNQDLTSIIEEINTTSTSLNKSSNADEPVSQIVRILNAHLTQLQAIDQDTAALRARISASQRLGDSLSGNMNGGFGASTRSNGFRASVNGGAGLPGMGGNTAVDDFYRAYAGRR
ncbi:FG-nucleoporin nsp1 [Ascosphaera pollenicola]|nr:FG-nucleoporin nsp1 [Ascosphaera pollenicola]